MTWFKVDDTLAFHRKVLEAGNAAMGLWVRAGSWSAQQLTDGFIPDHMIEVLGTPPQRRKLISSGLWLEVDGGCQFHEWSENGRQPTSETIRDRRATSAARQADWRARKAGERNRSVQVNAAHNGVTGAFVTPSVTPLVTPGVTGAPTRPDPTRSTTPVPRSSPGEQRARELAATAHTAQAHRLLTAYATTCTQRPPTDVLAQLGPRIDGLLTDGYTTEQVEGALAEWQQRGLAPSVLPSVAHQLVNGGRRSPLRVAATGGELTDHEVDDILGPESGPVAPREIENGDPQQRREWYIQATRAWRNERREQAQARLARRAVQ